MSGRGWAALNPDGTLEGHLYFHLGDDSAFRAERLNGAVRWALPSNSRWRKLSGPGRCISEHASFPRVNELESVAGRSGMQPWRAMSHSGPLGDHADQARRFHCAASHSRSVWSLIRASCSRANSAPVLFRTSV